MSEASRNGARSARRCYSLNPYTREPDRAEWQEAYDAESKVMVAEHAEAHRKATRSIDQLIDEGELGEALRKIADHLGILHDEG